MVEEERTARKATDPEYSKRINEQLNKNRVNFLVFGYGEEHGDSYQDFGGSISIVSYDLKTGKKTSISLSRDIRTPELETIVTNANGEKQSQGAITLREVFKRKGFEGMREIAEKATGLAVDYQIVMKDTVLQDYLSQISGPIEIEIDKNRVSNSYRIGGKEYPSGFVFSAGRQVLSPEDAIRYVIAEDLNPLGRVDERAYRKSPLMEGIINSTKTNITNDYNQITDQIKDGNFREAYSAAVKSTPAKLYDYYTNQTSAGNLLFSFDPNDQIARVGTNIGAQLLDKSLEGLSLTDPQFINALLNPRTTSTVIENRLERLNNNLSNITITTPSKTKSEEIVIHAPGFGDSGTEGGVQRLHQIWNNDTLFTNQPQANKQVQAEVSYQKAIRDKGGADIGYLLIPFGGNPYSNDLVNDYWKSVRCLTQYNLTGTKCQSIAP